MNIVVLARAQNDASPTCIYVHEQAKEYAKLGHNVIELCTVPIIPFMKYIRRDRYKRFKEYNGKHNYDGVTIIYIKKLSLSNLLSQKYNGYFTYFSVKRIIKKLLKNKKIDILHAHMLEQEGFAGYLIKKKFGLPVVVTTHGTDCFKYFDPFPEKYLIDTVNGVDKIVAVSKSLKSVILNKVNDIDIDVIYNGTNILQEDICKIDYHYDKVKFSILSVGTFLKRKNFDITIKAFSIFIKSYPSATLTLIGEGPEFDNLQQLVDDLNLYENVVFTGRLSNDEVIKRMKKHEIFLMPSVKEGFGIVYLESMQCACIPIALKDAGIADLVIDGKSSCLLESANAEEINIRLLDIYRNDKLTFMQLEAVKSSMNFTWKKNAIEYVALFKKVIM